MSEPVHPLHLFRVVRQPLGWAVRCGDGMVTPFRSRENAMREALRLRDGLRAHGIAADIAIDVEVESHATVASPALHRDGALPAD